MDGAPVKAALTGYDDDFFAWATEQAALLRSGRASEVDFENVAEEIEDLARRIRREIVSRLEVLLAHLLKWEVQPELRSRSWRSTISTQRRELAKVLAENPSLSARWGEHMTSAYNGAVSIAGIDTGLGRGRFRLVSIWSREQMLSEDFWPGEHNDRDVQE